MKLMKRIRDGKVAVYDQGCVESGNWVAHEQEPVAAVSEKPKRAYKRKTVEQTPLNTGAVEPLNESVESVPDQGHDTEEIQEQAE